jgi:cold shock CspA family protein
MTGATVPSSSLHEGRVIAFDARRGWGTVAETGGVELDFHATAIADGTRSIAPGTAVHFLVAPGHRGRYEARALTAIGSPRAT